MTVSMSECYQTWYEAKFARERKDMPSRWVIRSVGTPARPSYLLERVVFEGETATEGERDE